MNISSIQAAVIALVNQIVALVVGFGIIDNARAGAVIAASVAAVNVAFLIAQSIHANAQAKVTVSKQEIQNAKLLAATRAHRA